MKASLYLSWVLLIASCSPNGTEYVPVKNAFIKGQWENVDETVVFYRTLTFTDSSAVFTSLGDTIYRFKYYLDPASRTLWLTDAFNKKLSASVVKLDKDSLVLDRLWELNTKQRFFKTKAK